jgi:hypothetical protein
MRLLGARRRLPIPLPRVPLQRNYSNEKNSKKYVCCDGRTEVERPVSKRRRSSANPTMRSTVLAVRVFMIYWRMSARDRKSHLVSGVAGLRVWKRFVNLGEKKGMRRG